MVLNAGRSGLEFWKTLKSCFDLNYNFDVRTYIDVVFDLSNNLYFYIAGTGYWSDFPSFQPSLAFFRGGDIRPSGLRVSL